jgi:mRNA interferase RelE/StbE
MRQRIRSAVDELAWEPRPATSSALTLADSVEAAPGVEWEARRIKMDNWRVIYAINEAWHEVAILSVQQCPPYDYGDLDLLLSEL